MSDQNQRALMRAFNRAAASFGEADFLHREIRERLLDRFELVNIQPRRVLDLGAGRAEAAAQLQQLFPGAELIALDFAPAMLAAGNDTETDAKIMPVCAHAERLPLGTDSVDIVFSSLMLHWIADVPAVLREVGRVLRRPGLFAFTALGPGTLEELRTAWAAADAFSHVTEFMSMHRLGDALIAAGLIEPVLDIETVTVTYAEFSRLAADLKAVGATNRTPGRNRGLTGRTRWRRMLDAYDLARDDDGMLPVTVNIIYGHAWTPASADGGKPGDPFEFPLERLR